MESALLVVTVVSLLVALGTSVVAWRLSIDEKRRAAARVAALSAAAAAPSAPSAPSSRVAPYLTAEPATGGHSGAGIRQAPAAVELPMHQGFLGSGTAPVTEGAGHQRWLVAAAALFAVALGGFVALRLSDRPAAAPSPAAPSAPLELLSLSHEREGSRLSVAGLVRNPLPGAPVERLSAVVFLFDQQGVFVKSGTAPVDFQKLGAGDETPFVVRLDAPPAVARYRVSFRANDQTLQHVDRRGEPPIAAPVSMPR
jgi:hypothetical protein